MISPAEIFKVGVWFAFGLGAWLIFSSIEKLLIVEPLKSMIYGLLLIAGVLFFAKVKLLPF